MSKIKSTLDPNSLIDAVLSSDWDLGELELKQNDLERCPNSVAWMTENKFGGFQPFPRQIQFATQLFEDYCPNCSDLNVVNDMWGLSLSEIQSKVSLLQLGVCPHCKGNRNDFKKSGAHTFKHELIGIAGQRCLDGETQVLRLRDSVAIPTKLSELEPGDLLLDRNGTTEVKKLLKTKQDGYFDITFKVPGLSSRLCTVRCGHEHVWVTNRGELPAAALTLEDDLVCKEGVYPIVAISRHHFPCEMWDLETESGTFYHESGVLLHNSGKTFITAVFCSYLTHKFLCLDGVASNHYKGMRNTLLMGTFVASDKTQVEETTWGNFSVEVKKSIWYQAYFEFLRSESKRLNVKLLDFKNDYLWFPNKRIMLSYAAGNFSSLRGRTRFIGSIDELGWLESNASAKRSNAKEIYAALNNSLRTVRSSAYNMRAEGKYDLPTGYMFNVSSPSAEDDPIMTLAANSKTDPQALIFHYPTWEIRPDITRESLRGEFEKNPMGAQRDFGALPGIGRHIFLPNPEIMDASIQEDRSNCFTYDEEQFSQSIKATTYHYVKVLLKQLRATRTLPYCLGMDAGETGNGFALTLSSLSNEDETIVHGGILISPKALLSGEVATVHFPSALDLVKEIRKHVPLEMVVIDRWQSTSFVHELRDLGIEARRYSLKYNDFRNFKSRFLERKIKYPAPEIPFKHIMLEKLDDQMPIAMLLKQTRTVRDTGRAVTKPTNDDDDLFRTVVLADWAMQMFKQQFLRRAIGGYAGGSAQFGVQRQSRDTIYHTRQLNEQFAQRQQKSQLGQGSFVQSVKKRT